MSEVASLRIALNDALSLYEDTDGFVSSGCPISTERYYEIYAIAGRVIVHLWNVHEKEAQQEDPPDQEG